MRVGWFSCGCSSLVACKMSNPDKIIYIHVANQHPDTLRFLMDARVLLDRPIEVLQSEDYVSVDDVITYHRYINGVGGARCTLELKKRVRQKWEQQNWARHTYIWGFDLTEQNRAKRTVESMPEFDHEFPLIDAGLTKADCHALCADWGIKRPAMYDLGYPNNNCIGCVKGGARVLEQNTRGLPRRLQAPREAGARDWQELHQRHVPRRVGAWARNQQPRRTRLLLGLRDGRNGLLSATQTGAITHCGQIHIIDGCGALRSAVAFLEGRKPNMATMKNQADEMAEQFRHDCRMAAIKQAVKWTALFVAALVLITWLVMRG